VNIAIDPRVPEWVTGDHGRLRQVLLNLLNNAVKFTDSGSIEIEVRPHDSDPDCGRIHFCVTDTGVGIPVERQHRLFKRFSQADSSVSRRHGGTGLGLAICKRLVELMEGEIGIVSEVGRGATVWFTAHLPRAAIPAQAPAREKVEQTVGGRNARILVVDDIETNLEIVEAFLRDSGYRVECVSSGLDAIQLLSCTPIDLILMDVQMPVMDGVAATRRIRALPQPIADIPIIAMTGNVLPQQVRSFLAAGMNDHIGKPIDRAKLCHNIRRWLPKATSGAAGGRAGAAQNAAHFAPTTFDDFVLLMGSEKTKQFAHKFLERLSDAFQSTFAEAQREAHGFINIAGLLGLESLVAACRQASELSSPDSERSREAMKDLQKARMIALQMLSNRIFPKLQGRSVPGAKLIG
jgi:CheY-like chemotaxis protein/anti-sigma regulatory factor (Ser/Thr protein kinase)